MIRVIFTFAILSVAACTPVGIADNASQALTNTRVTVPPTNSDAGPLIFEFYEGGKGLFALNEVASRGQEPLTWRVVDNELCLSMGARPREECIEFSIRGSTITLDISDGGAGTIEPL